MTSGFTNSRDGRPTSCRLVVSVVNHSSVGLAEWWADLQNLHPRIFLNFNPCANFQTLDISYNMCSLFTVRLQVRVWQRWVERCGVSGHVICLSGFYATKVVGGWRDSWVRDYGWERQRGSKWGHYIQTDCAVPGLTAEARRLTAIVIMWWSWRGEWSRRSDASSPPCCCQSLHVTQSTTDAFFTHAARGCSLASSVAQRDTFCPSLAIYFISTTWQMRLGSADRPLPQKLADLSPRPTADCERSPLITGRQFCLPPRS